jgi:EAL domain-containing protein (putative c-di-GMP-specific phosphodiesterase class I)/CheY-like chemotaxis protein
MHRSLSTFRDHRAARAEAADWVPSVMTPELRDYSALIIDDDAFTRQTTARALSKLGAKQVYEAGNGKEAMRCLADSGEVDVIVCDLNMPEVDGIETLRHLAAAHSKARILLVSSADPRALRSAKEMAASFGLHSLCAVPKPLTLATLRSALAETGTEPAAKAADCVIAIAPEEFRRGLAGNELIAYFQPKVAIPTGRLAGVEALVRWRHPIYGPLPPNVILRLAEQTDLLDAVSDAMLNMAIAESASWRRQGLDITVGINLPVPSLSRREFPARLDAIAAAHGVEPDRLILEVTEDGWLNQENIAREVLTRLRVRGYGLSIDDFGTGYSTMQQLLHAPFSELKVDQSFVRGALNDEESRIVLASCITIAHQLKLPVVGEGVESEAQWRLLASLGCDLAQGYFVAPPMAAETLLGWVHEWNRRVASLAIAPA